MGGWKYGQEVLAGSALWLGDQLGHGRQWTGRSRQEMNL